MLKSKWLNMVLDVDFLGIIFVRCHKLLGFVDQYFFKCLQFFSTHNSKFYCMVLNHFHLTLGMDQKLLTLSCLHLYIMTFFYNM